MKSPSVKVNRPSALVAVVLLLATLAPSRAHSQEIRAVGGHLGRTNSSQLWGALETDEHRGLVLGAFVEVATPLDRLGVMVEASYVQRGGSVSLETTGLASTETVDTRVEYISVPVVLTARFFRNPFGRYAYAGPAVDYFLRIQTVPSLADSYFEKSMVLNGVAGAGLELLIAQRWSLRLEARLMEGLSPAFEGRLGEIRHRSFELLIRVGARPRSTGPPR